jgi:hypothetical protein
MQKTVLGGLLVAVAVLVGLTVSGLREEPAPPSASRRASPPASAGAELARETPPWQTPPATKEPLPAGTVPVWRVDPPRPDPSAPMPAAVVEPPNPATHRPPMDNPGGVNGDRPER